MEKILVNLSKEIVSLVKNYGADAVWWLVVLLYFIGIVYPEFSVVMLSNPNNVLILGLVYLGVRYFNSKKNKEENTKQTFVEEQETRRSAETKVRLAISKLIREAKANRVYVCEYHNGKMNAILVAFTYLDVTYEDCEDAKYVSQEYQNLPTSIYRCSDYLIENYNFIGSVEELENIDPKLAHRMSDNGVKYVGLALLKNSGINIGVLGLSYINEPEISKSDILTKLSMFSQDISDYLDLREYNKKK